MSDKYEQFKAYIARQRTNVKYIIEHIYRLENSIIDCVDIDEEEAQEISSLLWIGHQGLRKSSEDCCVSV